MTESLGIAVLSRGHSCGVAAPISGRVVSLLVGRGINDPPTVLMGLPGAIWFSLTLSALVVFQKRAAFLLYSISFDEAYSSRLNSERQKTSKFPFTRTSVRERGAARGDMLAPPLTAGVRVGESPATGQEIPSLYGSSLSSLDFLYAAARKIRAVRSSVVNRVGLREPSRATGARHVVDHEVVYVPAAA